MNHSVLLAIFKRNFVSYFLNPTGYVFICVFVLLSSLAAFWPNEFFTANLANLDQLNRYFPLIMLIFIPAITMSIWAEERRQGTDELLLTIPATDFDVVMGKYLASVAIFVTSLLFSLVCNITILASLGDPDLGLFASTYIGYLMVGLALLSVGMVASFLTSNITVGFVLGALFCAIPIGLDYVDVILPPDAAIAVSNFSIAHQLLDFTQGVWSLSSMAYFTAIIVIMLYLSIVLIGRRHWVGGRDGNSLGAHYFCRILALTAAGVGLLLLTNAREFTVRADLTAEGLNTLTPSTKKVVSELSDKRPIHIEAFLSPNPPKDFVPLRLDLIRQLREIAAKGGTNVTLRINDTIPFSDEADRAEKLYGIKGRDFNTEVRGQYVKDTVFLGVAITAGLDKIVIPFVFTSTPIEYEIVRSIATLNGTARKRLGLFIGDKTTFQETDPETQQPRDPEIVIELRKQYDVIDLDAEKPVPDNIDVLMAIQPTVMRPTQLNNLVTAIQSGTPTLIFQDPMAIGFQALMQQEEQANGNMPFVQDSDTQKLWNLLGVQSGSQQIVTQEYNPLLRSQKFPPGIVFVGNGALGKNAEKASLFNEKDPISAKSEMVVFILGGWVSKLKDTNLTFTPLVHTSRLSGYIDRADMLKRTMMGQELNPDPTRHKTGDEYAMVARIQGPAAPEPVKVDIKRLADEAPTTDGTASKPAVVAKNELLAQATTTGPAPTSPAPAATAVATPTATPSGTVPAGTAAPAPITIAAPTATASATGPSVIVNPYVVPAATPTGTPTPTATPSATASGTAAAAAPKKNRPMDVVIITDLDFIGQQFFTLRNQRNSSSTQPGVDRLPNFDNVTIVLNALDSLAGDNRFLDVRKHRPNYRTLTTLDEINNKSADERNDQIDGKNKQMEKEYEKEDARLQEEYNKLVANTTLKQMDKQSRLEIFAKDRQRRLEAKRAQLKIRLEKEDKELARVQNVEIRNRQDLYKALAVFIPPIFPLLIGLAVFFSRRAGEQEGVDRNRLR